jgi:tetratricopeptide (TPR) repeat protein
MHSRISFRPPHSPFHIITEMIKIASLLLGLSVASAAAQTMSSMPMGSGAIDPNERLGTVSFPVSCAASTQAQMNRGVALLHDFWYEEARSQFERIAASDPACAMAHWGLAMSMFHQIWGRPDAKSMTAGWAEMQKAQSLTAATDREHAYIAALADFYRPDQREFQARADGYSAAMQKLFSQFPDDVDAGAFYALSLLAVETPGDTSLTQEHKAMAVLTPLIKKYPDNPGLVHYIIHACDNPPMAEDGLAAANHYGEIAQSGPHAFHMPGHIYARLGMWPEDIASQLGSIKASEAASAHGESGVMDEPHSYDFLAYAYLQSGQDARAKEVLAQIGPPLTMIATMPENGRRYMGGMVPYFKVKLPAFYALEMRDWKSAAALEPVKGSPPDVSTLVYWTRAIGHGRLHDPQKAGADLAKFDECITELRKTPNAYEADSTSTKIARGEMVAWTAFASGNEANALVAMRAAADLQDKVGQGEVDIPAREMLADMELEFGHAREALAEYEVALKLSPNRLNGLFNAGRAAEAAGDSEKARMYYSALLKSTNDGKDSARSEFAHARSFVSAPQLATN